MTPTRRQFLQIAAGAGAVTAMGTLPSVLSAPALADGVTTLSGSAYDSKFFKALPMPRRIDLTGFNRSATITARQGSQQVLTGYPATTVYGYDGVWPGPTIVAAKDRPARVTWRNSLPTGTKTLADGGHLFPVDTKLIEDDVAALGAGQIPMVTHLHGAHVEWHSDGHPEAWSTQNGTKGYSWDRPSYTYTNDQPGTGLWYHDHTMGITRLNVGAGLAGHYLIRDEREVELMLQGVLPDPLHERELAIQDRSFGSDGQLIMDQPGGGGFGPPGGNGAPADFYGDFMCVNGTPWPKLEVEPRKYRFRIVNGSDSRFLVLALDSSDPILVVGSDQGLLPEAVSTPQLLVAPGERYDVVLDFSRVARGASVTMTNLGPDNVMLGFVDSSGAITNKATDHAASFGAFDPTHPGPPGPAASSADPTSTGMVMRFTVTRPRGPLPNARVNPGTRLAGPLPRLRPNRTRGVMTYFVQGPGGGMEMLGSMDGGTAAWMDPVTERVKKGDTEIWEIYNTGPVVHPIHLHLVGFQVLDRAPFTFTTEQTTMPDGSNGDMITVTGTGTRRRPEAWESGRKDTVPCYPGEVTRVVANFDLAGQYVWHCHLLHHEDHGMMRPLTVV